MERWEEIYEEVWPKGEWEDCTPKLENLCKRTAKLEAGLRESGKELAEARQVVVKLSRECQEYSEEVERLKKRLRKLVEEAWREGLRDGRVGYDSDDWILSASKAELDKLGEE